MLTGSYLTRLTRLRRLSLSLGWASSPPLEMPIELEALTLHRPRLFTGGSGSIFGIFGDELRGGNPACQELSCITGLTVR